MLDAVPAVVAWLAWLHPFNDHPVQSKDFIWTGAEFKNLIILITILFLYLTLSPLNGVHHPGLAVIQGIPILLPKGNKLLPNLKIKTLNLRKKWKRLVILPFHQQPFSEHLWMFVHEPAHNKGLVSETKRKKLKSETFSKPLFRSSAENLVDILLK